MPTVLPKQVQAQLDEAEALAKLAYPDPVVETPPADPPPVPLVPDPPPPVELPAVVAPDPATDQAYRTLMGKYNAEVPRVQAQNKELSARLAQVEAELTEARKAPPVPDASAVGAADEQVFGKDLIDLQRRVSAEEFKRMTAALKEELRAELTPVRERVDNVAQRQAVSDEDRYWAIVRDAVPGFQDLVATPAWLNWVNQMEPLAGATRQNLVDAAYSALDSQRTVAVLQAFAATVVAPVPDQRRVELGRQQTPSTAQATAPVASAGRIWTGTDFNAAFDPRLGNTMTHAEVLALQAEADQASMENRVDWGR